MADAPDREKFIRLVTEAVTARLEQKPAENASRKTLLLLLPEPISGLKALVDRIVAWRAVGWRVLVLAGQKVAQEAEARVLRGRLGDEVAELESAHLGEWLERLSQMQAVLLGGLGLSGARRLCQLDDSTPWVRLSLRALLRGLPVLAISDELIAVPAAREGTATREARRLLQEVERLGVFCVPLVDSAAELDRRAGDNPGATQSLGGLLSEGAVEEFYRSGARKIAVPAGTLITPLARTRAAELGLELVFEE